MRMLLAVGAVWLSACAPLLPAQTLALNVQRAEDSGILKSADWSSQHQSFAWAIPKLMTVAAAQGYAVEFADIRSFGYVGLVYMPPYSLIQIDDGLSENRKVATLAHEIAHIFQPPSLPKGGPREIFAEAVAFYACQGFGLDTSVESYAYLAQFPLPMRRRVLETHAAYIASTSAKISGAVKP